MEIDQLLSLAIERSASDLHLNVGSQPVWRIDGRMKKIDNLPPLTEQEVMQILEKVATKEQKEKFFKEKELDFSYQLPELGRHRVNVMLQQGKISIAFRQRKSAQLAGMQRIEEPGSEYSVVYFSFRVAPPAAIEFCVNPLVLDFEAVVESCQHSFVQFQVFGFFRQDSQQLK